MYNNKSKQYYTLPLDYMILVYLFEHKNQIFTITDRHNNGWKVILDS